MADLSGVLAKISRADEHREAFDDLVTEFLTGSPYAIMTEYDTQTGWHTLRWQVLQEPPLEELALVFGDMISNLRSSLDYLVWQLVLAAGEKPGRRTSFPVIRRRKDWEVQSRSALLGVAPEWVEEVEACQPYHRPERPAVHPLAILEHVNNLNKHRFLPAGVLTVEQLSVLINVEPASGEVIETQDFLDRPITQGGEFARFRAASGVMLDVAVNSAPHFRISFDDGLHYDWHPVELVEWVRETVARFAPAFP